MNKTSDVNEYIDALKNSDRMGHQVAYHMELPGNQPQLDGTKKPLPKDIEKILHANGIRQLYTHQASAIDLIRDGHHVVVSTPTASGKTYIYNIPVIETYLDDTNAKALYIFPLKALAQDQLRNLNTITKPLNPGNFTAEIYDGDTTQYHRKRIRENPPNVLLTNPEMVHLSLLAHHHNWSDFFSNLKTVVIDEIHTYRGVMGSHMSQVFRRLQRICNYYGSKPTYIFCSATIGNPSQLAHQLTGFNVEEISKNGAPKGKRHVIYFDPVDSPAQSAILLLKAALHRDLKTIVYTQSRKMTELIAMWASNKSGKFAKRISAYRAGFLPEERRDIEAKLFNEELLAVISTSALELGIDVGGLDLCILVGYPGSLVSTWQRGGRVGRSGQDSALILIAGEDALDQYFIRNPKELIHREPESAVINPHNHVVLSKQLVCAAAELPIKTDEDIVSDSNVDEVIHQLVDEGKLLKSEDGAQLYSSRKAPHRFVDLRGTGSSYTIVNTKTDEMIGEVDGFRAFKETHTGAVYLHKGNTFVVDELDLGSKTVHASEAKVDYYTRVRSNKNTEILTTDMEKTVWGTTVYSGTVKVTEQITGYERRRIYGKSTIEIIPLDLPPLIFETEGLWFEIPPDIQNAAEKKYLHFMGGIHAMEHAAIGVFPLLVMADRNDLGGISTPFHEQLGSAAIFIYDGIPGGAGLSTQAYERAEALLEYTLNMIEQCECEQGCPSCVHSPKCGSGNRPIDKSSAIFLLKEIKDYRNKGSKRKPITTKVKKAESEVLIKTKRTAQSNYCVIDIETQRSAQEVGGWHRADRMGISCIVMYDSNKDTYLDFSENQVQELIDTMKQFDLIIGFNIVKFDYLVLRSYTEFDFRKLKTLDILNDIYTQLGYRLSLDHLASVTLGKQKTADGLQALRWWKEGRIQEIIDYCKQDVMITRDLFLYGQEHGYLLFKNKAGSKVRVPVEW